jgi:hypothetical protein
MAKYMSQVPPEPKPKAGPKVVKQKPKARKIAFGPAVPTPKRASKQERTGMEMPKKVKPKRSFDDAVRTQNNQREIMGSTKAQRAASALELMNDMRSRNILRTKIAAKKRGK